MSANETAKDIDRTAADWVARLDRGALSPQEDRALETWLAGDPRRVGAFARAQAISMSSERAQALGTDYEAAKFAPPPAVSRRQVMWGGGLAAGLAAAGIGAFALNQGQIFETRRGEMKVIPLSDGSVISLNTASKVKVSFSSAQRLVHLIDGEALFDVAKDSARPFIVKAADATVRAIGTSFTVQKLAATPLLVMVREGVVELSDRQSGTLRLTANTMARAEALTLTTAPLPADKVERALAWREGRIAFEGQTLSEAISTFARYSDTRIVIDDPALAREEITGLFQSTDPVGFAQTVALSFDLTAEVGQNQVRLSRKS
ncbi:FecR domain-containing protein [Asticcacaulis sp. ZE23SCel15]|uniref:FecR family protein n=1 Tax=Asticcacaulis sp. ZE23SCel15 TaxID=3059027 RepID=UPI00265FEF4B|nr:FecR domain-containing protein [Asticcacaulis sp. ZE23SCel15]WKL57622.1 FecR domain-containing protein [Asticcacaulis sp. ZE23SCel15]